MSENDNVPLYEGQSRFFANPDEPSTPYEAAMFDSMGRAQLFLEPILHTMAGSGFLDSEAISRGFLLAVNRMLGARLIEHCANQGLPIEALQGEIETCMKNLELMVEEHYETVLGLVIQNQADEATKQ